MAMKNFCKTCLNTNKDHYNQWRACWVNTIQKYTTIIAILNQKEKLQALILARPALTHPVAWISRVVRQVK